MEFNKRLIAEKQAFGKLYNEEKNYTVPNIETSDKSIWRYMDFSKFVALLDQESLFFTKPAKFFDPYEGAFSERDFYKLVGEPVSYIPDIKMDYDAHRSRVIQQSREFLDYVGVSCWHLNRAESAAMWDLYLKSGEGIAIRSTISNLYNGLNSNVHRMYFGEVQYINYLQDMASVNTFETLFYKRESFSHEKEFRVIVFDGDASQYVGEYGANIKCDLNQVIEEIYISPTAPKWFAETVASVVKKYELNKPITQSSLYQGPKSVF
nr:DUF2971 domain-containing protein [Bacillus cereus]